MNVNVRERVRTARRVSVPILAVNTPDQRATIAEIVKNNGAAYVYWTYIDGYRAFDPVGREVLQLLDEDEVADSVGNPYGAVKMGVQFPENTVVFFLNAHHYLDENAFVTAVGGIRDEFKTNHRTLILLGPSCKLPTELQGDVVVIDEPLPDPEQCGEVIDSVLASAGLTVDDDVRKRAVEAVTGLPAFQIEQVVAMSLTPDGIVMDDLWEFKRQQIEATAGLEVHRGGESMASVGGCSNVLDYCFSLCSGYNPGAVVRVDEIEKMLAGEGDTSGVSQALLGKLLSHMEDNEARGVMFVGPPGCSKSLVSKVVGNEAGVPTINFDLGNVKGGLVGQSEANMDAALKVIDAVSNGRALWIATANSIDKLNTALLRRFPKLFYFDLPDDEQLQAVWRIQRDAYGIADDDLPECGNWSPSDVRDCCRDAKDLCVPLKTAARWIVPVGVKSASEIRKLRERANGTLLDASKPGYFTLEEAKGRRVTV